MTKFWSILIGFLFGISSLCLIADMHSRGAETFDYMMLVVACFCAFFAGVEIKD